jgi:hypothetical protein
MQGRERPCRWIPPRERTKSNLGFILGVLCDAIDDAVQRIEGLESKVLGGDDIEGELPAKMQKLVGCRANEAALGVCEGVSEGAITVDGTS